MLERYFYKVKETHYVINQRKNCMICRYIIVYLKRIRPYRWLCAILF